jgi:hypothetical protein
MIFGLDLKDLHGFWYILVGILLVRHLRRESTRGWRAYASTVGVNAALQGSAPESGYYGEILFTLAMIVAIGIVWSYLAPDVTNITFPNQWP